MLKTGKFDLAVSIGYNEFIDENGFNKMKQAGIKAIEISFGNYDDFDFKTIKELSEKYQIELWSLHLPFMPFETIDISSTDNCVREYSINLMCDIISKGVQIGIKRFVLHPSGEPVLPPVRAERMKCSKDSLYRISEFAKKYNAVIAVENLPRTCLGNKSKEINELVAVNDNLVICFDTNHLFEESAEEFINNLNKNIETVHISDYDYQYERHWLPYYGKIDWESMKNLINSKGYNGPWLYEISFYPKNLPDIQKISLDEVYTNYCKIF